MQITTIGLDIAKNVFQVHGIDVAEKVVVRKQLRRGQRRHKPAFPASCIRAAGGSAVQLSDRRRRDSPARGRSLRPWSADASSASPLFANKRPEIGVTSALPFFL